MQEHYNMGYAANREDSVNVKVVIIGGGLQVSLLRYLLVLEK
jgi:hypothetical protein